MTRNELNIQMQRETDPYFARKTAVLPQEFGR